MLRKLRRHWSAQWLAGVMAATAALLPLIPSPAAAACYANCNTMTGGGRTNTWDSQNRLVQCAFNGTTTINTYASDGLRHRSVVGANTTDTILDQTMQVRELLNGAVKATYLVGPRGPEYRRDDQAGSIRWYVYDGLGSVVGEVDPSGNLTRAQTFDVYGAVRTSNGTATTKQKFVGSLGHPSDDETGLIYTRARHYDPVCGRFNRQDPSRQGTNWFAYCGNDPIDASDPSGRTLQGLLMGAYDEFVEKFGDSQFGRVALGWGRDRIESCVAYHLGQMSAYMLANMDEGSAVEPFAEHCRFGIRDANGYVGVSFDMTLHLGAGSEHIDFSVCSASGRWESIAREWIRGFIDGLGG